VPSQAKKTCSAPSTTRPAAIRFSIGSTLATNAAMTTRRISRRTIVPKRPCGSKPFSICFFVIVLPLSALSIALNAPTAATPTWTTIARKSSDVRYLKAALMRRPYRDARPELGAAAGAAAADLARIGLLGDLERVAAAAARDGVRVVDLEPGLLDRLEIVDRRAPEIRRAERVDDDRHALAVERVVALLGAAVEAEAVLEA